MNTIQSHHFHIPVMGLAYTVDTPIKVAQYGISSVVSIVEDSLIERMRAYYYNLINEAYKPITTKQKHYRSRRITDYLNLMNKIVQQKFEHLKQSAFETGSEIVKYFELLPDDSLLKQRYNQMVKADNEIEKNKLIALLKVQMQAGSIDVNIMTKVDKNTYDADKNVVENGSDALTALKGYADSDLTNSSVVFSAGMNPRLFAYLEHFSAFDAKAWGLFDKKVIVKVSDYRSALIQGKILAKKGIWVSEFRVESGLNCGGHAFASDGFLLGPILAEFKAKKQELANAMFELYNPIALAKTGLDFEKPHPLKITVQGGIGTFAEDLFLRMHYQVDGTGWGTPFLLVPEATTVDADTLKLLAKAIENDVVLSDNSPLGVKFNYLKGTSSDMEKQMRMESGKPGSPCTEKCLVSNTEFTQAPICTASIQYQKLKVAEIKAQNLSLDACEKQLNKVLAKECLCIGLANAAMKNYQLPVIRKNQPAVTICPGPNIAYFNRVVTLQTMVDHIYGRGNVLGNIERPHMFIKELELYINYLKDQVNEAELDAKKTKFFNLFYNNLLDGIGYYQSIIHQLFKDTEKAKANFVKALETGKQRLNELYATYLETDKFLACV